MLNSFLRLPVSSALGRPTTLEMGNTSWPWERPTVSKPRQRILTASEVLGITQLVVKRNNMTLTYPAAFLNFSKFLKPAFSVFIAKLVSN